MWKSVHESLKKEMDYHNVERSVYLRVGNTAMCSYAAKRRGVNLSPLNLEPFSSFVSKRGESRKAFTVIAFTSHIGKGSCETALTVDNNLLCCQASS